MGTGKISQHIKGNEQKVLNQHFLKWRKALKHFHQSQEQDMNVHSFHTYSTVLEILARAIRQLKEIQMGKEVVKVPLSEDDRILCKKG